MKVWVVMGDDSPREVFISEENATAYMEQKKLSAERARQPIVYWRMYWLELRE